MSQDGPKLYINKPKKEKRKIVSGPGVTAPSGMTASGSSYSPSAASASYSKGPPPPPPTQPPKEPFVRRYKFLWPLLLGVNLVVGGYYFLRTKDTVKGPAKDNTPDASTVGVSSTIAASVANKSSLVEPVRIRDPISESQQRKLFKWILEEKRKVKPTDYEEKRRLDEDKAILKQFIRAKSLPQI